LGEVKANKDSW